MSGDRKIIRVGSRKSELALVQTNHVISLLKDCFPEKEFEIVTMNTLGDKILDIALPKIGEKSLFTKELETALSTGCVDFVVHSLKDLPTTLPSGLAIGAVLTREDPRDALVLQKDLHSHDLSNLPENSVIGTSSLRRTAQLTRKYSHLKVENIRGNLNTRLKKLDELGKYQAIILATAGLIRIGWKARISKILTEDELLYAVGQGALAVQCKTDNKDILKLLEPLYDLETAIRVTAERSFLKTLGGGCSAPVAVSSSLKNQDNNFILTLTGAVWSLDGKEEIKDTMSKVIKLENDLRCNNCPYNKNNTVRDIENLDCKKCTSTEPAVKKPKLADIPTDLLKTDPHDSCPIKIPIGSDFMGKCPYLEGEIQGVSALECPFLKNEVVGSSQGSGDCSNKEDDGLFCGLVAHKEANVDGMYLARKLGEELAHSLIKNGALGVMTKAQDIIHGKSI